MLFKKYPAPAPISRWECPSSSATPSDGLLRQKTKAIRGAAEQILHEFGGVRSEHDGGLVSSAASSQDGGRSSSGTLSRSPRSLSTPCRPGGDPPSFSGAADRTNRGEPPADLPAEDWVKVDVGFSCCTAVHLPAHAAVLHLPDQRPLPVPNKTKDRPPKISAVSRPQQRHHVERDRETVSAGRPPRSSASAPRPAPERDPRAGPWSGNGTLLSTNSVRGVDRARALGAVPTRATRRTSSRTRSSRSRST